ncbi:MAG: hypothetical protein OHK0023_01730 [Anaerolineae bacterium]
MSDAPKLIPVVCIEDDTKTIDLVTLILRKEGFDVTGVTNGRDGLAAVERIKPRLVLLDLMMPEMDGWEVYQAMRHSDTLKEIPVIVLTAKAESIDKVLGLHIAKVNDYITKPFSPSELIRSVQKVLEESKS